MLLKSLLTLLLTTAATAQLPNFSDPPARIENKWVIAGGNNTTLIYADLSGMEFDKEYGATTIWVRIYDRGDKLIFVQKWAYRKGGNEHAMISSSSYTLSWQFKGSVLRQPWELKWSGVVPNSFAHGVQQMAEKYLTYLKNSSTNTNNPA